MRHHASCSRSYVVLILRSTVSDRKMSIQEHWSRNYRALARKHFQSFTLCQANTNRKLLSYGPTLSQIVGAAQFDICLSDSMDNPPKIMQYGALFALIVLDTRQSVRSVPVQKAVTVRFLSKKFRNGWQMPIICSGAVHVLRLTVSSVWCAHADFEFRVFIVFIIFLRCVLCTIFNSSNKR